MKKIYLLLMLQLGGLIVFAQSSISGKITDQAGESIPGASILIKNSSSGTISDYNGEFKLEASRGDLLIISFLGYETLEISVSSNDPLTIALTEKASQLDEVVVTALGLERQTRDLGYPVQRLNPDDLIEAKTPNFIDNLAGKLAGVTISQGATGVGSTSKIVIRGEASFTNNNPLFVVDGTPISNNTNLNFTNAAAAGFQEVDFGNGGMELNADDIASLSVLKGPGAAALYGTRASNGVIIITTKDGSKSKGLGISFNSSLYLEQAFQLPQFQNEYGQGNSGQFEFVDGNGGGTNDLLSYSWGPKFSEVGLIPQFNSPVTLPDGSVVRGADLALYDDQSTTPTEFKAYPDNLKDFYETGVTTINNLSIGSGFRNGSYRFSITDMQSKSIIPGVNLDRKNIAARLNFRPKEALQISTSINYVNSNSDNRPSNGYGSENVNYSLVAWGPRSLDIAALKDYWQPGLENREQFSFNYAYFDNPYFILKENRNSFDRDRVFGNIRAQYNFTDNLSLAVRTGMDYSNEDRQFRRHFSTNRFKQGAYAEQGVEYRETNSDILLNYNESFGNFSLDVSLGGNRMDQIFSSIQSQVLTLAVPGVFNLSNGASPIEIFQNTYEKRINSAYGLAKFGFRDYVFVEVTGRNDWSSSLPNPSFFYPSVAATYVLSNAFSLPRQVSFAKLRASWAQVGNDTSPYQTASTYTPSTPVNSLPTFTDASTIANANLLPEQTTAIELGADVRFFDDRLSLDVTYYNALTENQIISLPISITSGYEEEVINGGEVRSQGVEAIVSLVPVYKNNFTWRTQANFSRNVTTVETLPDNAGRITLAYSSVYDNPNQAVYYQVEEGGRIGDMYGTGYLKNGNNEFIINSNGQYIVNNDLMLLGNYNPDFIIGWNNELAYKNWNANFLFDWRHGGVLVSRIQALAGVAGQLEETGYRPESGIVADGVVNVGTEENPIWEKNTTAINPETYYRQYYDRNHEENNTYDASYIKLRQLAIGYTFNNLKGSFLSDDVKLSVSLIGRNLFAISEIPHFDPEQLAVQGNQFVSGVEDMSYATTLSYGIKISLNF
ncbi:MAG: SusC/RagA family TonB-linked outer membrane protein [Flammeovirgaceae bacterium]|nr:SusC/RagA family TonB-linked outer membrane protein [Flammeovirgaceae bacterium]HCX24114.1 SusC/RagA family TonB-linked outer membrane protein [Cytophagales bacterium]|tara:strand:- start:836 stop:4027 length:3192 start_codon:yes stop_codon:yes gene_type:complete